MNSLEEKIIAEIKSRGPITFDRFMDMALYDTQYGYYFSEESPIGRSGDFYTSSHLHPVFGRMIGKQMEEMWELLGKPGNFTIAEFGAGEGHLCRDMLGYLSNREMSHALSYIIIERSPLARERQKRLLGNVLPEISWAASLSDISSFAGCIFSNELLDAFPVHMVEMHDGLKEIYVGSLGNRLIEELGPLSSDLLKEYMENFAGILPEGYRTEVNLKIRDWYADLCNSLERGFVFTVDYGYSAGNYYSEDHNRGTLMCYRKHQLSENPYEHIGNQDITAHVNFSAVEKLGREAGFSSSGFANQGSFLVSLGIDEEIKRCADSSKDYLHELGQIKELILPGGMGETHQVLIQSKGINSRDIALKGFSLRNRINSLL